MIVQPATNFIVVDTVAGNSTITKNNVELVVVNQGSNFVRVSEERSNTLVLGSGLKGEKGDPGGSLKSYSKTITEQVYSLQIPFSEHEIELVTSVIFTKNNKQIDILWDFDQLKNINIESNVILNGVSVLLQGS